MKKWYLIALIIGIFSFGCEDYKQQSLPASGGSVDEILVVMNDDQVQTAFSDTLIYFFMAPYEGISQYEPKFKLRIKKYSQFEGAGDLLNNYRNIIFCSSFDHEGSTSTEIKQNLGNQLKKVYSDSTFYFIHKENIYATPQLVVYLFAPDEHALINRLTYQLAPLFKLIKASENKRLSATIFVTGEQKNLEDSVRALTGIKLRIPSGYLPIVLSNNASWLKKESTFKDKQDHIQKEIKENILIRRFDITEDYANQIVFANNDSLNDAIPFAYPIALRDSAALAMVKGKSEEYSMYTDIIRPIWQSIDSLYGKQVIVTRGLWRLDNPFMGGPFVNYCYWDDNGQLVMLDGFIYAAGSEKKKLIREMEVVLSGIHS